MFQVRHGVCILREEFSDHFKCLSLDHFDFLTMPYLEHKDTILEHYFILQKQKQCELIQTT
jgi:hypothetical protein